MNALIPQITAANSGEEITLVVGGNILSTNVQEVRQKILDVIAKADAETPQWKAMTLDLTAAQMIDSTGLNFLVALLRHVKKHGAELKICVSSANISKSFSFIRLDRQAQVNLIANN